MHKWAVYVNMTKSLYSSIPSVLPEALFEPLKTNLTTDVLNMADWSPVTSGFSEAVDLLLDFVFELFPLILIFGIIIGVLAVVKFKRGGF